MQLLYMVPHSNLKYINSHFYILYNDLFYHKIRHTFGDDTLEVIVRVLPWLKPYIKSLDAFRYENRKIIAKRLDLIDTLDENQHIRGLGENEDEREEEMDSEEEEDISCNQVDNIALNPLNVQYVKDSWKYIYSIFKNKRLFAEYSDYKIDEPSNYIYNHFVEINRTYLLSYSKYVWLSPGTYNLNVGLAVKYGHGLGTTKFEVKYNLNDEDDNDATRIEDDKESSKVVINSFYPPTNINDILPKNQFCFLKVGLFEVPPKKGAHSKSKNKMRRVEIKMEEIGLYLKSGFRIYFIDISQPSLLYNEYDLLYYTLNDTNYKLFINILLKNLYKAINYVQNGGCSDNMSIQCAPNAYGKGDPYQIWKSYDKSFLKEYTDDQAPLNRGSKSFSSPGPRSSSNSSSTLSSTSSTSVSSLRSGQHPVFRYDLKKLERYADFYYNSTRDMRRYFKFSTIYQQRQFINRFGDYDLDWKESEQNEKLKESKSFNGFDGINRLISEGQQQADESTTNEVRKDEEVNINKVQEVKSRAETEAEENSMASKKRRGLQKRCNYDKHGLKWKIPIIGEL